MDFSLRFFSIAFTLFLLMDSLGNIPLFMSLLKTFPEQRQRVIILRELCIALLILITFYFIGNFLLDLIQVKQHTVLIAGGIILFVISIRMVFSDTARETNKKTTRNKEPFIVPLAIPLLAGPATLASMMLYSKEGDSPVLVLSALFFAWAVGGLLLLSSSFLKKILGERGLSACEKLMGLLLTLISVQMFLEGISSYLADKI